MTVAYRVPSPATGELVGSLSTVGGHGKGQLLAD